jgi:crossover junction endodeoxyribonuclease RuvC
VRVLGIDPGLTRCGIGVVDGAPGRRLQLIHVEVACTDPGDDIATRLLALQQAFETALDLTHPDAVAVERVFSQHNVRTVMGTAQAGAVAIVAAARRGLPVALHTPSEVKAAVTGNGRADKDQVGAMVTRLLSLTQTPRPADAADALALAICHLWRGGATARLSAAQQAMPASRIPRNATELRAAQAGAAQSRADRVRGAAVPRTRQVPTPIGTTRSGARP